MLPGLDARWGAGGVYVRPRRGRQSLLEGGRRHRGGRTVDDEPGQQIVYDGSGDGQTVLFAGGTPGDLYALALEGQRAATPLLETEFNEIRPSLSPGGQWIAFESDEEGQAEIYVRPFPDLQAGQWKVSTEGGRHPVWSPDGRELFYQAGPAIIAVPIDTEPTFRPGNPERLFKGQYVRGGRPTRRFDIAPDGQRFLMVKPGGALTDDAAAAPELILVQNWHEELKRLVPVD